MGEPIAMTSAELEALHPELFRIARQLRARDEHAGQPSSVRMHSIRVGDIDPESGQGGQAVKVKP